MKDSVQTLKSFRFYNLPRTFVFRMYILLFLSSLYFFTGSCTSESLYPDFLIINDTIVLKPNEVKFSPDSNISIMMDSVLNDSRCPRGLLCIWAGNARVRFIFSNNTDTTNFILNTHGGLHFRSDTLVSGYRVKLLKLNPYPDRSYSIQQKDYRAEIIINTE